MLPPEAARFELREGTPVLTLSVDPPAELTAGDWGVMSRLTMVVVDGPGDAGFLLPRLTPGGDAAPDGWDEAIDRVGGSHVLFGSGEDAVGVFARNVG
jgi:hypothetical protein